MVISDDDCDLKINELINGEKSFLLFCVVENKSFYIKQLYVINIRHGKYVFMIDGLFRKLFEEEIYF